MQFDVVRHTPAESLAALINFESDMAFVFDSVLPSDVHIVASVSQPLYLVQTATRWPQTAYSNCRTAWLAGGRRQIAG